MKVLALAAHPDDIELLCAGTLALLSDRENDVTVCHMTVGDKGGTGDRDELARTRAAEAKKSAGLIGARYIPGFCGDLELLRIPSHLAHVREVLEEVEPELVLTHAPNDYHPDHRITGLLGLDAARGVSEGGSPAEMWYMDNLGGVDFTPELYVDIEAHFETKQAMLKCHESQIAWMSQVRHTDMEYVIDWVSRWRGLHVEYRRAEGFRLARGSGKCLLEALGDAATVDQESGREIR